MKQPTSTLTKKKLVIQCSNIKRWKLLLYPGWKSRDCNNMGTQLSSVGKKTLTEESLVRHDIMPPVMTNSASTELGKKLVHKLNPVYVRVDSFSSLDKVPSQDMLGEVSTGLLTILTATITDTNKLIYATVTVILEKFRCKIKSDTCRECPPMKKAWGEVSCPTEVYHERQLLDRKQVQEHAHR